MQSIEEDFDKVQYWMSPKERNQTVDFIVPPDMVGVMKDFLRERQINFEVVSKDLQVSLNGQLYNGRGANENL
jgi:Carboxypeptidase activation peptide